MKPATLLCRRIGGALWPVDEESKKLARRLPAKKPVAIRLVAERSREQLALYWQVLGRVVDATGRWHTPEELHLALKIATGRVGTVHLLDGRAVLVPASTAFDQMTQDEFQSYFDAAMRIVTDEIMGGVPLEEWLGHARLAA
jgi:hypothetical protein